MHHVCIMATLKRFPARALLALSFISSALPATAAGPVGIDGVIGPEWAGITPSLVTYNPSAPISNFNTPGSENHNTGYEIFARQEAEWIYVGMRTTGPTDSKGLVFSNLSFALLYGPGPYGTGERHLGFEVTNDRAFSIDGPIIFAPDNASNLIQHAKFSGASSDPDVIEAAFHWSIFWDNALGVSNYGLPPGETFAGLRLYRSQSFGYSVAGGTTIYGPQSLGLFVAAPEPGALSLMAAAGVGAILLRRRRR